MENKVKALLRKKRDLDAESRYLHEKLQDNRFKPDKKHEEQKKEIDRQRARIENWLMILTDDEAHVITRHLIDGIDLPRVAVEYKERWGADYAKTERTIKSYQRKALAKIARFEKEHSL